MTTNAAPLLEVRGLGKSYGPLAALTDLSFRLGPGEILGLLGPNGAGKTTALECILGLRKPDRGSAVLLGQTRIVPGLFERIGVQFQHSPYPDLITLGELCAMRAALYRRKIAWRPRLRTFGLEGKERTRVSRLSGGQKQRLAVLLALIHNPDLIFLDELTTGLDPRGRRRLRAVLQERRREGAAFLLTSHYMDEVRALCDRIIVLHKGATVFAGSPEELIRREGGGSLEEAYLRRTGGEGEDTPDRSRPEAKGEQK